MVDYLIFVITRHELPCDIGTNGLQDEWIWFQQKHWLQFIKGAIKNNQIYYSISLSLTNSYIKYAQKCYVNHLMLKCKTKKAKQFLSSDLFSRVVRLDLQN